MNCEEQIAQVVANLYGAGWREVDVQDIDARGFAIIEVSAPGAASQISDVLPPLAMARWARELGGPGLYPALVEYDPQEEAELEEAVNKIGASWGQAREDEVLLFLAALGDIAAKWIDEERELLAVLVSLGTIAGAAEFATRPAESFPALSPQAELMVEVAEMKAPEKGAGVSVSVGGRCVYRIVVNGKEIARSVYLDSAKKLARNWAKNHDDVHLYQAPIQGHISTALPRPVGERH